MDTERSAGLSPCLVSGEASAPPPSSLCPTADDLDRWGMQLLAARRLNEAVDAFTKALTVDPNHWDARVHLGDACKAVGNLPGALASYQEAMLSRPLDFSLRRKLAHVLLAMRYAAPAEGLFRDLLLLSPDDPDLLADVALALGEQRRFDEVPDLCARALKTNRNTVGAHVALSLAWIAADRLDEAEAACHRAIKIAPENLEARINLAVCHLEKNRRAEAIAVCTAVLAFEPNCQEARWNLALAQLAVGNFVEGWRNYESRKHRGYGGADRTFSTPLWDGVGSLQGRRILLHAEQGLGDTIQFVRYAPHLAERGAQVLLEVQPPLRSLVKTIRGVTAVFGRGEPLSPHDLQFPLLSLPRAFDTRLESIPARVPYLHADAARVAQWRRDVGDGCRIGLVWSGSAAHGRDIRRSIPLATFASALPGAPGRLFSLQKETRPADSATLAKMPEVIDLSGRLHDFGETAAVLCALDLVITVDTAVAHLAGALGRPVWVLLPYAADWRWLLDRTDSPWYPTMRLFRQSASERWEPVLDSVREALRQWQPAPAGGAH